MTSVYSGLAPVFSMSVNTCEAWMKNGTVWRVTYANTLSSKDEKLYNDVAPRVGTPHLRLVFIPNAIFADSVPNFFNGTIYKETNNCSSFKMLFIDNLDVIVRVKSNGNIDHVEISYLLEDRRLLNTHTGIVVDIEQGYALFFIGQKQWQRVELYKKLYPLSCVETNLPLPLCDVISPVPLWTNGQRRSLPNIKYWFRFLSNSLSFFSLITRLLYVFLYSIVIFGLKKKFFFFLANGLGHLILKNFSWAFDSPLMIDDGRS